MENQNVCCFTGPRPHKLPFLSNRADLRHRKLIQALTFTLIRHIEGGCDTFLCGMAQGADLLFAQTVLDLKRVYHSRIKLVCVLPYRAQAERWPAGAQAQHRKILYHADERILLQQEYTDGCLLARNRYMADHSAHLIAVYGGDAKSGTGYTVNYAQKRGLHITIIDPNEDRTP